MRHIDERLPDGSHLPTGQETSRGWTYTCDACGLESEPQDTDQLARERAHTEGFYRVMLPTQRGVLPVTLCGRHVSPHFYVVEKDGAYLAEELVDIGGEIVPVLSWRTSLREAPLFFTDHSLPLADEYILRTGGVLRRVAKAEASVGHAMFRRMRDAFAQTEAIFSRLVEAHEAVTIPPPPSVPNEPDPELELVPAQDEPRATPDDLPEEIELAVAVDDKPTE